MLKKLLMSCSVAIALTACATPSPSTANDPGTADFCEMYPAADLAAELDEPITVTKRLLPGPDSPWAYCFYGSMTSNFVTLSAPIAQPTGNVHVVVDPRVADRVHSSVRAIPDDYRIEQIDIPRACRDLWPAAEAAIGKITLARGSVNTAVLTCDFIGANGSITAQSRPHVLAAHTELTGIDILDEPDARLKAVLGTDITINGIVDHCGIAIKIRTPHARLTEAERTFARDFLAASREKEREPR